MLIYITKNMNPNHSMIPCFIEKKSKTTLKIYAISKQSLWFFATSTSNSSYYSIKPLVSSSSFSPLFSKTLPFWTIPSHIIMIQTTIIQNSNQKSSLISPYPNYLVHQQSRTHPPPLTDKLSNFIHQGLCKE